MILGDADCTYDFRQLKLFVDLVRVQSFTKVAEINYITQPAVSLSMQKLEEELGVKLFERTTRKVLVTQLAGIGLLASKIIYLYR